ncbi:MAG: uracil phosphoribosyltransferase [Maribacter sp.]|jgi:uracil phosphoribosyltransferase
MIFNLNERDTIANKFIAELRSTEIQGDRMRFRRNLERIGEILAYEISKTFDYEEVEVETPLGTAVSNVPKEKIIIGTILRAGLPMHQGVLNVFDDADNAFVSAYRRHHKDGSFEIKLEYVSCPNLDGTILILADPMIATGASIVTTIRELLQYGKPKAIHVVAAIAAAPGIDHLRRYFPKANIWLGALDDELTAKSYIVPGLGDAGDLAYGEKLQD